MQKSDTDSNNYSTIDESATSTESTLRYCLWKKGTQFTYDIPDGLIEGDCVEVKGRLTGHSVVMELSGGPSDRGERLVPLRFRFGRRGHYKIRSDYQGWDKATRGKFKWDSKLDNHFEVQIRVLHKVYDIRVNSIELIKFEHGQLHSGIQMLALDGEAEFTAVEFIDVEDMDGDTSIGEQIMELSEEQVSEDSDESGDDAQEPEISTVVPSEPRVEVAEVATSVQPQVNNPISSMEIGPSPTKSHHNSKKPDSPPPPKRRRDSSKDEAPDRKTGQRSEDQRRRGEDMPDNERRSKTRSARQDDGTYQPVTRATKLETKGSDSDTVASAKRREKDRNYIPPGVPKVTSSDESTVAKTDRHSNRGSRESRSSRKTPEEEQTIAAERTRRVKATSPALIESNAPIVSLVNSPQQLDQEKRQAKTLNPSAEVSRENKLMKRQSVDDATAAEQDRSPSLPSSDEAGAKKKRQVEKAKSDVAGLQNPKKLPEEQKVVTERSPKLEDMKPARLEAHPANNLISQPKNTSAKFSTIPGDAPGDTKLEKAEEDGMANQSNPSPAVLIPSRDALDQAGRRKQRQADRSQNLEATKPPRPKDNTPASIVSLVNTPQVKVEGQSTKMPEMQNNTKTNPRQSGLSGQEVTTPHSPSQSVPRFSSSREAPDNIGTKKKRQPDDAKSEAGVNPANTDVVIKESQKSPADPRISKDRAEEKRSKTRQADERKTDETNIPAGHATTDRRHRTEEDTQRKSSDAKRSSSKQATSATKETRHEKKSSAEEEIITPQQHRGVAASYPTGNILVESKDIPSVGKVSRRGSNEVEIGETKEKDKSNRSSRRSSSSEAPTDSGKDAPTRHRTRQQHQAAQLQEREQQHKSSQEPQLLPQRSSKSDSIASQQVDKAPQAISISSRSDKQKPSAKIDGVYRVVPVTPVAPETPAVAPKSTNKQANTAKDMSKGDMLWKSEELNEDELISLSISLAESSITPSSAKNFVDEELDEESNANRVGEPAKLNGTKVPNGDRTLIDSNADSTLKKHSQDDEVNDASIMTNPSTSRQYMYYGAGEKSPPDHLLVVADDIVVPTRTPAGQHMLAASTPANAAEAPAENLEAERTAASTFQVETSSPELARKAGTGFFSSPMGTPVVAGLERSPWGIRDDPEKVRNRQGSQQSLGSPSPLPGRGGTLTASPEPVYSKVYDTIDVEPMPSQTSKSSAASAAAASTKATSTPAAISPTATIASPLRTPAAEEDSYDLPAPNEPPPTPHKRPSNESIIEVASVDVSPVSKQKTTPRSAKAATAAKSNKKLSKSAGSRSPGRQRRESRQHRLHLFCRSQSYSLERAERSDRITYPEAMSDGIYRAVEDPAPLPRSPTPPPLPPLQPLTSPSTAQQSESIMTDSSSPLLTARTTTTPMLTTPAMLPNRASCGDATPETLGPASPTTPSFAGGDDADSVWWTDVSFRDRLSHQSSAGNARPQNTPFPGSSSNGNGEFILTAPPDPSVADLVESASLVSDAAIREPPLCSFRRSIQENLLAQRQPTRICFLQTYRKIVEPENHSSFFHTPMSAIDFAKEADGEKARQQEQQLQFRRTASATSSISSLAASSSTESRVSTDSSLEAALVLEADGDCLTPMSTWCTTDQRDGKPPKKQQKRKRQQRIKPQRVFSLSKQSLAPFVAHLPEPLRCGRKIIVSGQMNDSAKRATISLKNRNSLTKPSPARTGEEEFQVQLEVRADGCAELSCRQFNGKAWTENQKAVTSSYRLDENGRAFTIEIQTTSSGFAVKFEDALCVQPHTLPFSNFTHLVLDGNSDYQSVDFPEELELPYSEEFPQSLDLVSHILVKLQTLNSPPTTQITFGFDHGAAMLCVLDLAKQSVAVGRSVTETGGFLCETKVNKVPELISLRSILLRIEPTSVLVLLEGKPIVSYNLLDRKVYITSFFIDGNFTLKDVAWKEKRALKLTPLPSTFQVGRVIHVIGRLPPEGDEWKPAAAVANVDGGGEGCCCNISLVECNQNDSASVANVGFCLRCEPRMQPTISASSLSASSTPVPIPPLEPNQRFEACILYRLNGFELLQLGDHQYPQRHQPMLAPHQLEPKRMSHVLLSGGAIYYEVEFPEQLHLPYFNRFPVSLKESRFVTVEIASGGLPFLRSLRPTTISFALCCGPGDSGLKPLVCQFNVLQGYASVAWADSTGQLRDEETRKFDPRLTNDVEVVALQATDTEYILSCNETAVLTYAVRHDLSEIHYVLIDGDAAITNVKFEGRAPLFGCCIN